MISYSHASPSQLVPVSASLTLSACQHFAAPQGQHSTIQQESTPMPGHLLACFLKPNHVLLQMYQPALMQWPFQKLVAYHMKTESLLRRQMVAAEYSMGLCFHRSLSCHSGKSLARTPPTHKLHPSCHQVHNRTSAAMPNRAADKRWYGYLGDYSQHSVNSALLTALSTGSLLRHRLVRSTKAISASRIRR